MSIEKLTKKIQVEFPPGLLMPTLPWCVGPIGLARTPLSSQIPQDPLNVDQNVIKIPELSADSSGHLICWFIADYFSPYLIFVHIDKPLHYLDL